MRRIIVCDFDGTLIKVNSFPRWVSYFLLRSFFTARFLLFGRIIFAIFSRKVLKCTHVDFKARLMSVCVHEKWNREFSKYLLRYVNKNVVAVLERVDEPVVLSSAAPVNYLRYFPSVVDLDFDSVFGSSLVSGKLIDNFGFEKVRIINECYCAISVGMVLTDHFDDIPLMQMAESVMLVSPSVRTIECVRSNDISFHLL